MFTQALELEVELDFGDTPPSGAAGIGFLPLDIVGSDSYVAQVSRTGKKIDIGTPFGTRSVSVKDIDVPQHCKLRMQIWGGIVSVFLDDKPVKTGYLIPVPIDLDGRCSVVVSDQGHQSDAKVGFRNLRVRKLTSKPAGMEKVEPWDSKALLKQLKLE